MASAAELRKEGTAPVGGHGMPGHAEESTIRGFSHMVFEVSDLDRSEQWYRDVMALDVLGRGLLSETEPHTTLRLNTGQLLVLVQVPHPEPRRKNTSSIHHALLLTMEQYRAAQQRFAEAGYDISDSRESFRARGEYSMDVFDPDDHRWQVQAYDDEAHAILTPGVGVVDCGPADAFEVGSVTTFREGNFFLVRDSAGFYALSRWCRHMNGLLSYQHEHWRFYCAFHGATYDLEGEHTGHIPDVAPLRTNATSISAEGHVLVDTDLVMERASGESPDHACVGEAAATV